MHSLLPKKTSKLLPVLFGARMAWSLSATEAKRALPHSHIFKSQRRTTFVGAHPPSQILNWFFRRHSDVVGIMSPKINKQSKNIPIGRYVKGARLNNQFKYLKEENARKSRNRGVE